MVQCAIAGCTNESRKTGKEISYHKFPNKEKDNKRYKVWVERCRRKYVTAGFEGKKWEPAKSAVICGLHFSLDAFERHPLVALSCNISDSLTKLRADAIPTIFWYDGENAPTRSPSKLFDKLRPVEKKRMVRELLNSAAAATATAPVEDDHESEVTNLEPCRATENSDEVPSPTQDTDDENSPERQTTPSIPVSDVPVPEREDTVYKRDTDVTTEPSEDEPQPKRTRTTSTTYITVPHVCVSERKKTYVKTTQTKKIPTAQQSAQYSLADIGLTPPAAPVPVERREQGVQCTLIGGRLILDEEDQSSDDEDLEYPDNPDLDPDWYPEDEVSNSDDDMVETEDVIEPDVTPLREKKYLVFQSCLLSLFALCTVCFSKCTNTLYTIGTLVKVKSVCANGHVKEWYSGPFINKMPVGNLCVAAAAYFSGCSTAKVLNFMKAASVSTVSRNTYYRIQKHYLVPAINSVWMLSQAKLLEDRQNRPVKLAGDGRCCSPGHTAKYGSYSLMDAETGHILCMHLIQSNEVSSSYAMELEGLKRGMSTLIDNQLEVTDLITDRHSQVRKWLKTEHPQMNHWFDVWHIAKSIKKKLDIITKKPKCDLVGQWTKSITNHLYWCAASSNGNKQMVVQKWISIERHITNIHEGHGELFPKCLHGDLNRNWIGKETKAHKELKAVIHSSRLKNDIEQLSGKEQTSALESFHNIVCFFAPKHGHFFFESMEARLLLAALHFNENVFKKQAVTSDGTPQWKVSYPKFKKGKEVVSKVTTRVTYDLGENPEDWFSLVAAHMYWHKKTHTIVVPYFMALAGIYGYVDDLMDAVWSLRTTFKTVREAKEQLIRPAVAIPRFTTDKATKVSKADAVANFRSRFNSSS